MSKLTILAVIVVSVSAQFVSERRPYEEENLRVSSGEPRGNQDFWEDGPRVNQKHMHRSPGDMSGGGFQNSNFAQSDGRLRTNLDYNPTEYSDQNFQPRYDSPYVVEEGAAFRRDDHHQPDEHSSQGRIIEDSYSGPDNRNFEERRQTQSLELKPRNQNGNENTSSQGNQRANEQASLQRNQLANAQTSLQRNQQANEQTSSQRNQQANEQTSSQRNQQANAQTILQRNHPANEPTSLQRNQPANEQTNTRTVNNNHDNQDRRSQNEGQPYSQQGDQNTDYNYAQPDARNNNQNTKQTPVRNQTEIIQNSRANSKKNEKPVTYTATTSTGSGEQDTYKQDKEARDKDINNQITKMYFDASVQESTAGTKTPTNHKNDPAKSHSGKEDDRWIWNMTSTPANPSVDDRAAFTVDQCPTDQVRFNGVCVDKD